ncbi:uncharacterized protein LOC142524505 isoform X1 [Primulina tabacum]|uniref:uncharacterized protein LOC142524505 isoform X1 n=1 Tax=Primulina tabacum TaxID=48773 RepID=UPI003F5A7F77
MSKLFIRKQDMEKVKNISKEKEKSYTNIFSKRSKKIYPFGLHRTCSPLSLSSLSLSLSHNSTGSCSLTDSSTSLEQKISFAVSMIGAAARREVPLTKIEQQQIHADHDPCEDVTRRCNWITKNSDEVYVQFHDECWGVPVYDDNQLFELLAMCGMLMDFNWTEILKRRIILREAFLGFDAQNVSKMGEKEMMDIYSDKELTLPESRVRCIVENARCINKIAREYGSFSSYLWDQVNYKPIINKFRHSRNVPLRSPKAETMSKELMRHGFRLVGPVIVYSFMQAAGMTIDHLVYCFRYKECVDLVERPWKHV